MSARHAIVAQFRHPKGALGRAAGWIMAHRPSNRARNLWTVDLLDLGPRDRALEIGCGPGIGLEACARALDGGSVLGLDHSETMVAQARKRLAGVEGVAVRLGGLDALVELPGSFDKIFSVNVIQFVAEKARAFADMAAVASPGGLVAATHMPRHRKPTRQDAMDMAQAIRNAMEAAGLGAIETRELPLSPVPAICVMGRKAR